MQATSVSAQLETATRPTMAYAAAGDRLYLVGRLLIVLTILLMVVAEGIPLFPVALTSPPLLLVLYAAVGVLLLSTLVTFVPPLRSLVSIFAYLDLLLIGAVSILAATLHPVLLMLYILPVTFMAVRSGSGAGLGAAVLAVALMGGATFLAFPRSAQGAGLPPITELLLIAMQGAVLLLIPPLVNVLKEAWGANNSIALAAAKADVQAAQQAVEAYRARMHILFDVAKTLGDTMSGTKILDGMLENAHKLVPYDAAIALLPTGETAEVRVDAGYGLSIVDRGITLTLDQNSVLVDAFSNEPRALFVENISAETALHPLNTPKTCQAAVIVPMHNSFEVYGLVLCMRREAQPFTPDEAKMIESLTIYATCALINAAMAEDLKQDRVNLSVAQERARHDLAREIHDGLAQKLAAIAMNIDFIKRMVQTNPPAAVKEMDRIGEMFRRANYDVRTLLGELKPTTLEQRGLPSATEELLERYRKQYPNMTFEYKAKNVSGLTLAPHDKSTLYNIIQESINNAIKHAEASKIEVRFEREGYRLLIAIQDNGKGFDVEKRQEEAKARGSHGLSNLKDRAAQVMVGDKSGTAEIHSAPGKGTTVLVRVPLEV